MGIEQSWPVRTKVMHYVNRSGNYISTRLCCFLEGSKSVLCVEVENCINSFGRIAIPKVTTFEKLCKDFEGEGCLSDVCWADHEAEAARVEPRVNKEISCLWKRIGCDDIGGF